jgi:uncharacterized protein (TIGR00369 family)
MKTLNAKLSAVKQGCVNIECPFSEKLTQHHGFFHAGVITSLADNACGFAALTMMPKNMEVVTVEFKINFLKPAKTNMLIATGKVIRSGRTLTVCEGSVYDETGEVLIAVMTATMMAVNYEE